MTTPVVAAIPDDLLVGDVVQVTLHAGSFTYRGVVTHASRRNVYVNTRHSGHPYRRGVPGIDIQLIERTGRSTFRCAHALSQTFP